MARAKPAASWATNAEMLAHFGGISPERVCFSPLPGTATEKDLVRAMQRNDKLYELIDGTLVEKVMGYGEGFLAADLILLLGPFIREHDLGDVGGPDAMQRILPGMVRLPDVSFVRWEKYVNRERPTEAIPDVVPDLAIEILSEGNTLGEISRKIKDYLFAGVEQVWIIDPRRRTVEVVTNDGERTTLSETDVLDGGKTLPGLKLRVRDVFARVPRSTSKPSAKDKRSSRGKKP